MCTHSTAPNSRGKRAALLGEFEVKNTLKGKPFEIRGRILMGGGVAGLNPLQIAI